MKRAGTAILLSVTFIAVIGFIVFAIASVPKPTTPDFDASSATAAPTASASSILATAPTDPCHHNSVTYCVLNPAVTQATIRSTICVSGWTATVRPAESYTEPLKLQQMSNEGLSGGPDQYEEDHRMPLELGGDPRNLNNLSPESHATSYAKDAAENTAKRQVCNGADLSTVQAAFVRTWLGPYPAYAI